MRNDRGSRLWYQKVWEDLGGWESDVDIFKEAGKIGGARETGDIRRKVKRICLYTQ